MLGAIPSPELRALLSYSASNRTVATLPMIRLRQETEAEMDRIKRTVFEEVEAALAEAVDEGDLAFADGDRVAAAAPRDGAGDSGTDGTGETSTNGTGETSTNETGDPSTEEAGETSKNGTGDPSTEEAGDPSAAGTGEHATGGADDEERTPRFRYDTRLLLPALLTLARVHIEAGDVPLSRSLPGRSVDEDLVRRGYRTTSHVTRALLDGDLRDALNDEEYEDVATNLRPRRRVAEVAQEHLEAAVEDWFDDPDTPAAVRRHYSHAVDLSESHQAADSEFGALLDRYHGASGDRREEVRGEIRDRYKFAAPSEESTLFDDEFDLPYFVTQYERVGILYEDMLGMYEADLGVTVDAGFERAIVLMVVAAQIGLDDTDDYEEDRGDQLTPVTAELALGDDNARSVERLRTVVETYLDRAEAYSTDHLTGVAIEFIRQQSLERLADLERTLDEPVG